jgi:tRNA A37 threonylcarbamoyladenosine synthetase subunit TsaC/SUA5/YrdC
LNRNDLALPEDVANAAGALQRGELIVFPTETFYAIGADPMQPKAPICLARRPRAH